MLVCALAAGIGVSAAMLGQPAQAQAPQAQDAPAADGAARPDAAEERSQSFQAVRGAVKEDVPGGPLLVAAYAAIWIALLLYVIRLARLQQRVQSDVERLERVLARDASPR
jgi:CcmD family protein